MKSSVAVFNILKGHSKPGGAAGEGMDQVGRQNPAARVGSVAPKRKGAPGCAERFAPGRARGPGNKWNPISSSPYGVRKEPQRHRIRQGWAVAKTVRLERAEIVPSEAPGVFHSGASVSQNPGRWAVALAIHWLFPPGTDWCVARYSVRPNPARENRASWSRSALFLERYLRS